MRRLVCVLVAATSACSKQEPLAIPQPAASQAPPSSAASAAVLLVREVKAGSGERFVPGDIVTLTWLATKDDGSVFEDRRALTPPMQMRVGPQVPQWWEEGLQQMRAGGRYHVAVPIDRMWPAARLPAALKGCKQVTYEVQVAAAIRMPQFAKPDPTKTQDEAGCAIEVVSKGAGAKPAAEHWCAVHFAVWNAVGELIDSSYAQDKPMRVRADSSGLPYLDTILPRMAVGSRWRGRSPVGEGLPRWSQILGVNETIYWFVEMVAVTPPLPVPAFTPPTPDAMTATASGVRVAIDGGQPAATPTTNAKSVEMHYACWLADGTLVESSQLTGMPNLLALALLPTGLREGLTCLPVGVAGWIRVPAALAYGDKGLAARNVPPNADLIVRAEILRFLP